MGALASQYGSRATRRLLPKLVCGGLSGHCLRIKAEWLSASGQGLPLWSLVFGGLEGALSGARKGHVPLPLPCSGFKSKRREISHSLSHPEPLLGGPFQGQGRDMSHSLSHPGILFVEGGGGPVPCPGSKSGAMCGSLSHLEFLCCTDSPGPAFKAKASFPQGLVGSA